MTIYFHPPFLVIDTMESSSQTINNVNTQSNLMHVLLLSIWQDMVVALAS
jgi:hypothetical protein